jgi:hypothetical protein
VDRRVARRADESQVSSAVDFHFEIGERPVTAEDRALDRRTAIDGLGWK